MTEAEYLAADHATISRLDFIGGRVVDVRELAAGGYRHSRVVANLLGALHATFKGSGYRVHGSDLRLGLAEGNFAYPDALIERGEAQWRHEGPSDTLLNLVAVYEVLSQSSVGYDTGPKKNAYASTSSIQEILLVHMDLPLVERYVRDDAGWRWKATVGLGATLRTVGVDVPMAEIYAGVTFPEA